MNVQQWTRMGSCRKESSCNPRPSYLWGSLRRGLQLAVRASGGPLTDLRPYQSSQPSNTHQLPLITTFGTNNNFNAVTLFSKAYLLEYHHKEAIRRANRVERIAELIALAPRAANGETNDTNYGRRT